MENAGAGELARAAAGEREHGFDMSRPPLLRFMLVRLGERRSVLGCLTGRDDVVFGWTVAGRPPEIAGVESMVGLFINTVPARVRLDRGEPLAGLLRRVQAEQAGLLEHQYLDLTGIQQAAGTGELFDTTAVLENYPLDPGAFAGEALAGTADGAGAHSPDGRGGEGLRVSGLEAYGEGTTHYPLSVAVLPGRELVLRLGYRPDAVPRWLAEGIADRFTRVL